MDDLIFALDIGTRKVMGIVGQMEGGRLKIIDSEVLEHPSRTMYDGHIHNVAEVTKVVKQVLEKLEDRTGRRLDKVGVALAGRAVKTLQSKVERERPLDQEITPSEVSNLELEAVSKILSNFDESKEGLAHFHCVGYSVVFYELDGLRIDNLVGHYGRKIAVEVISTFLPRIVIDSMFSVLKRVGLEAISLTLEPIAAINVIIPPDMRRLNLLLVDIGAGTSDMAVTRDGAVVAYGMVPEAGDEITEALCEKYLLDFNTGERVKRALAKQDKVGFENILGEFREVETGEIIEAISGRVKDLAKSIADCALKLNRQVPTAVVCVGGGSLTPGLMEKIAKALGIEGVGIRGPAMIKEIEQTQQRLVGPETVTPIGIAVIASQDRGIKYLSVYVNNRKIQLLDIHQRLDVVGALMAASVDRKKMYGRPGMALSLEINGKLRTIRGGMGKPSIVKVNGRKASLSTNIKDGDRIEFCEAVDGQDARAKIRDIVEQKDMLRVNINGTEMRHFPTLFMNGGEVDLDTDIVDRAKIEIKKTKDVRWVLVDSVCEARDLTERQIMVSINGEPKLLTQRSFSLTVNGRDAGIENPISDGDVVEYNPDQPHFYRIKDVVKLPPKGKDIAVNVNGIDYTIEGNPGQVLMNDVEVSPDEFLIDGAKIITRPGKDARPILSHIFNYHPIDLEEGRGKVLRILVDGKPAGFTTPLVDGSKVELSFQEPSV